jgi:hypothetical protein
MHDRLMAEHSDRLFGAHFNYMEVYRVARALTRVWVVCDIFGRVSELWVSKKKGWSLPILGPTQQPDIFTNVNFLFGYSAIRTFWHGKQRSGFKPPC